MDVTPGRRVAARLQEAAVHGESWQLPGQFEDVVMFAALVANESLEEDSFELTVCARHLKVHREIHLDVQVDGNVLWRKYRYVDRGRRLLRVHDVALAFEDSLGEYQDALYYRLIRRREADLDMSLQHSSIQQCRQCPSPFHRSGNK